MRLSASLCHFWQCPFDKVLHERKEQDRERWVGSPIGEEKHSHAWACREALVGTVRAISVLFGIDKLRNKLSYLVGPPFQHSRPVFQACQVGISQEN